MRSGLNRYTAEWSVDLSGMNGNSLPGEVLFNHACRLRRWEKNDRRETERQGWKRQEVSVGRTTGYFTLGGQGEGVVASGVLIS
ncbi:MAG: hypothetical protein ACXW32_12820, partial [Limisphaerales bacterium]